MTRPLLLALALVAGPRPAFADPLPAELQFVPPDAAAFVHVDFNGWSVDRKHRLPGSFPDGTSRTLAVVTAITAVPWTKPDEMEFALEADARKLLLFRQRRCPTAMFSGGARLRKKSISHESMSHAITPNDGYFLGNDF